MALFRSCPLPRFALRQVATSIILLALAAGLALCQRSDAPEAAPGAEAIAPDTELQRLIARLGEIAPRSAEERRRVLEAAPDLYALAMLKLEKADLALRIEPPTVPSRQAVVDNLSEAVAICEALREGRRPDLEERGRLERAYFAANDMSPQPYSVYVPDSYDGTQPYGLLVFLHGYTPYLDKLNWTEAMYCEALETLAVHARCIVLLPYGRGNTDFQGAGEDDVLRAIGEVTRQYAVDPDRVFLSGISMGGMGVWSIGAHYSDRFAALIPIAGRGDFYLWKRIARGSLPDFKAKLIAGEFGAELLPNYRHLRCVIVHGLADATMPIEYSQRMQALLSGEGFRTELVEVPGATHNTWEPLLTAPQVLECLQTERRQPEPRTISLRTATLKHSRAYWAEITGIEDWGRLADLSCELDESGTALTVTTANVTGLRLRPPSAHATSGQLRVTWNGQDAEARPGEDGWLELGGPGRQEQGLRKTPVLCGPIREAFSGPFVIVYDGGEGEQSYRRAWAGAADWLRFAQGLPTMLPAEAVTPEVMERCHLILYGTPEDNRLIRQVAPHLPIGLGNGRYRIKDRTYDASRYGLSMIYPNPLAPSRYVVVNSGPVWGAELARNHKYDMLPDFVVFAPGQSADGTDADRFLCAGFFDQHWQLSEASTWHGPEAPDK